MIIHINLDQQQAGGLHEDLAHRQLWTQGLGSTYAAVSVRRAMPAGMVNDIPVPLLGYSVDGRYKVVQNGAKGFWGRQARRKWREYGQDQRVLMFGDGIQHARSQQQGRMHTDFLGWGDQQRHQQPSWVDDILSRRGEDPLQAEGTLSRLRRPDWQEWYNRDNATVRHDVWRDHRSLAGRGRGRGDGADRGRRGGRPGDGAWRSGDAGQGSAIGYMARADKNTDGSGAVDGVSMMTPLLAEEEDGLTTFRIDAVNKQEPIQFELGEVIQVQSTHDHRTRRWLQIEDVILGRETLVNDAVGMQRRRAGQGTEPPDDVHRCQRSKALYTAYVRAKVTRTDV